MNKTNGFCLQSGCPFGHASKMEEDCVFNIIIYEDDDKVLFYNVPEKRIFIIKSGKGFAEIGFQEAIREIDIIPQREPEWKRVQILKLAKELGFFGIN
ncbi:MAG: hypothetical protein K6A44_05250 [bacterium]|nr:hypothetical protein [bacterium]